MNKQEFIAILTNTLKVNKLQTDEVIVGAGGACLMFGVRNETADIDISVNKEVFDSLKSKGFETSEYLGCPIVKLNAFVDAHLDEKKRETVFIEGVHCQSMLEVLKFKEFLNRPKDQADIKALKEMIYNKGKD